jgi:hypothetical protein
MNIRDFLAAHKRADALRRLGGPDVDAEKKRNAMNGEQKTWLLSIMTVSVLLGWLIWNFASYQAAARSVEARSRPSADEVVACVSQCATACADQAGATP